MADIPITVVGNIATNLQSTMTKGGRVATFRLASSIRRWDRNRGWYDAGTNFFTVTCWRQLAENVVSSLAKGEPVVVSGRMQVRPWKADGREGTTVDIEASAVGHDLNRGTSAFRRAEVQAPETVVDTSQLDQLHRMIEAEDIDADSDGADLDDVGIVGAEPGTDRDTAAPAGRAARTSAAPDGTAGAGTPQSDGASGTGAPTPDGTARKATAGSERGAGDAAAGAGSGSSGAKAGERAA